MIPKLKGIKHGHLKVRLKHFSAHSTLTVSSKSSQHPSYEKRKWIHHKTTISLRAEHANYLVNIAVITLHGTFKMN